MVTAVFLTGNADFDAGLVTRAEVEAAAKTSVTTFLVYVGMLVLLFVEPPTRLFAIFEPISPDRRPTYLAIVLGIAYAVVMLVPPFRDFFNLSLLGLRDVTFVLVGVLSWSVLVWIFWRYRFVDRFLGADDDPGTRRPVRATGGTDDA